VLTAPGTGARADAGAAMPGLGGPLEFLRLLWAVAHGLERVSKRMEATLGVTGPQRLVLRLVGRFPSITAGRLARLLHVHPSTLTAVLKRLEGRGLVHRRRDSRDRRRTLLGLTPAGRRFDVSTAGTVEAAVGGTLDRLSPAAVAHARRALSVLVEQLDREPGA
jgi:DNA-binding MarR family transcriptional regulator